MKSACILALAFGTGSAFVPSSGPIARAAARQVASDLSEPVAEPLNGWVPDESKFAWGLPGSLDPAGEFDPLGFAQDCSLDEMKRYREAEVTHGRVSMLAVIGFLTAESYHPLFGGEITGPAIRHLDQVRAEVPSFFELLVLIIGSIEFSRARKGWTEPATEDRLVDLSGKNILRESYYPGDIGFDPAGLKPTDAAEFAEMQTKELQHGRLAMLASMGFIAQELVNGVPILENLSA